MEKPPSHSTSKRPPIEKWKASTTAEKIDPGSFSKILAIYTAKDGKKKSTWLPITFAESELIRHTLRVVEPADLKNVEHPSVLPAKILTADTPLDETEIRFFTTRTTNYYTNLAQKLEVLDKVDAITPDIISETIQTLIERCQKSQREYHPLREVPHTKAGTKFNPNYEKDLPLDEVENKINQKLKDEFKKLRYDLYPPMNLEPEKFEAFAQIFNLLLRSAKNEMAKVERKWEALSTKELGLESLIKHLGKEKVLLGEQMKDYRENDRGYIKRKEKIKDYDQFLTTLKQNPVFTEQLSREPAINVSSYQYRDHALKKKLLLFRNDRPLIWTQFLNNFGISKADWNIIGNKGKIEREWAKFGALVYPDLAEWFYSKMHGINSTQPQFTLNNLFHVGLRSPELCGMIKYLDLLEPEITKLYTERYLGLKDVRNRAFELLAMEEQRLVLDPESEIDGNEGFIFPIDGSHIMAESNKSLPLIWRNLEVYLDGLLEHLDLNSIVITGSAIPAAVGTIYGFKYFNYYGDFIKLYQDDDSDVEPDLNKRPSTSPPRKSKPKKTMAEELKDDLKVFYPNSVTIPADYSRYRQVIAEGGYRVFKDQLIIGKEHLELTFEDGADIDLAVLSENDDEFEKIVQAQFKKLKTWNPKLKLIKTDRKTLLYEISGHSRKIQLYPSSLKQILTHHLAMVRGFVYGNGPDRMIYCSASALYSFYRRKSLNYYYFAGVKSPADVILKYEQRGYSTDLPKDLRRLIDRYANETEKWNRGYLELLTRRIQVYTHIYVSQDEFPALFGYGNFSITDLAREEKEFKDKYGASFSEAINEVKEKMKIEKIEDQSDEEPDDVDNN